MCSGTVFEKIRKEFAEIFKRRKPHKQGLGKALPNKIPMGQNERTANYGTSVESCSDNSRSAPAVKLRISPSAAYNDRKGILPKNVDNFFEKMGVKKRLAMQTAQKNIYLTYEKST